MAALIEKSLLLIVASLHIWFFVLERFLWTTPRGLATFKMSLEQARLSETLAGNQGFYNFLLAIGLLWAIVAGRAPSAAAIKVFILLFIFAAGIYGALTVNKSIFFIQSLPALGALVSVIFVFGVPRINDITTSFDDVPQFTKIKLKNSQYNNKFQSQQMKHYGTLQPLELTETPDKAFALVRTVAESRPQWNLVSVDEGKQIIEGYETTKFFRFRDDFVIRVSALENGSRIDMRSKSRTGQSDFGVNAKRIQDFFQAVVNRKHENQQ